MKKGKEKIDEMKKEMEVIKKKVDDVMIDEEKKVVCDEFIVKKIEV